MGALSSIHFKDQVRRFWELEPCGTRRAHHPEDSREFFLELERDRERTQPFIDRFARFGDWSGKRVLEVGVGPGVDFVRFVRAGARATGIDLTEHAVRLARARLDLERLSANVHVADAECLPFDDEAFDFVYSWGVIHHTPDPPRAAMEIVRVTRPGGEVCVMVYHRRSLVALQSWVVNGLLRGQPFRPVSELIWDHHESAGTRAYTIAEARGLFGGLEEVTVTPQVTAYDVRLTRTRYAPGWVQALVPGRFGWFLVIEGRRPRSAIPAEGT